MLALVVARPGSVRDGLVALLSARPDVRKLVQIEQAEDAWDFVQTIFPDITLIHASPLTQELSNFISQAKQFCQRPLLTIVNSEVDRKTAVAQGADVVVMEGLPSAKLAGHITALLHQNSATQNRR